MTDETSAVAADRLPGPLAGLRVLELADEKGQFCAKLMADLSIEAGIDRLVTWHPHSDQLRGFYGSTPVEMLDPLPLFLNEFRHLRGRDEVIVVAPDAGASKLITYLGRGLNLNCAIASKYRPRAEEAVITEVIGDFSGKRVALVIDDMISSGGTISG